MTRRRGGTLRTRAREAGLETRYLPAGGGAPRAASPRALRRVLRLLHEGAPPDAEAARRASEAHRARERCVAPHEITGRRRVFGLWTHLYSLRSDRGFGVGNTGDLRRLVRWAGERGARFVGLNPLHAVRNRGEDVSPYAPVSRLFRNPIYLDVTAVPEWRECAAARRAFEEGAGGRERRRLCEADRIDYERSDLLRERVVAHLFRAFRRARESDAARGRAFERYARRGGELLRDYATFRALEAHLVDAGHPRDWRRWPAELRSPRSEAVRRFRERHPQAVERIVFEQFELDRQLAGVAREAQRCGLSLGLYQDLALGCAPSGFDTWAFPHLFVDGASLGAPPDDYAAEGQDWGLPPLHPWRVGEADFGFLRRLLRAGFESAGMLRIDHALGLLRQWWVPRGSPATDGVYVRFPASALLSVVAEESRRAGAVVVGEDLGTVPPGFQSLLARHGVLSCRVLLFERRAGGGFRRAAAYPDRALATANTHDLPTLAGWWSGRDLMLRAQLGELEGAALERARDERRREREALVRRLRRDGALPASSDPEDPFARCAAVHRFLRATPASLVGLSLDDLCGETEPVNLPGVPASRFPSWRRRMARPLDALLRDPDVERALGSGRGRRGR